MVIDTGETANWVTLTVAVPVWLPLVAVIPQVSGVEVAVKNPAELIEPEQPPETDQVDPDEDAENC